MVKFLSLQYRLGKVTQSQLMQAVNRRVISAEEYTEIIEGGK